jgi:hypothetical protein
MSLVLLGSAFRANSTEAGASSSDTFSFARELADGSSSLIVVPHNHTVKGDFDAYRDTPLQLTR